MSNKNEENSCSLWKPFLTHITQHDDSWSWRNRIENWLDTPFRCLMTSRLNWIHVISEMIKFSLGSNLKDHTLSLISIIFHPVSHCHVRIRKTCCVINWWQLIGQSLLLNYVTLWAWKEEDRAENCTAEMCPSWNCSITIYKSELNLGCST